MIKMRDEFLSEEDLDLKSLTDDELDAVWTAWLEEAQSTNEEDKHKYSHGVFLCEPPWQISPVRHISITKNKRE